MITSSRVLERSERPEFRISKSHLEDLLSSFSDSHFAYVFEIANSNGVINFIGKINPDYPRKIDECYYETNITGFSLAYLDALVDFLRKRDWPGIHQHLLPREVENFLRDTNDKPAFPTSELKLYRIHECLNGLESYLQNRFLLSKRKKSPVFKEEDRANPFYNKDARGAFFQALTYNEQLETVEEIFDAYIREGLERDGGGAEVCYVGDNIISLRYTGNCGECSSSLGTTLEYIQETLRFHLQENNLLVVTDS